MNRYEELEKLYYKKKILKFFLVAVSVFFIVLAGLFIERFKKHSIKTVQKTNKKVKLLSKEVNSSKKEPKKVVRLILQMPDINKILLDKNIIKKVKKHKKIKYVKHKVVKKPKQIKKENRVKIAKTPKIEEKKVTLKELVQKYNVSPSYELAIIIAQKFFEKKDYVNAQLWALKANNLNPEDVKSWIIFAKILKNKNENKKALQVLKTYIDTYGPNSKVENIIRSINE